MFNVAIAVPTYNEVLNLPDLLERLSEVAKNDLENNYCIIIVDDKSPDGTLQVAISFAKELESDNFNVLPISKADRNGLGGAYYYAFQWIFENLPVVDCIVQMDADLSHNPMYLEAMINNFKAGSDAVITSRYIPGGGAPDWSAWRLVLSKFGNIYARIILGGKITDYTGGYNLYRAELLKRIDFSRVYMKGYGFQLSLKNQIGLLTNKIKEIPIVFNDRKVGQSKMPISNIFQSLALVVKIKLGRY